MIMVMVNFKWNMDANRKYRKNEHYDCTIDKNIMEILIATLHVQHNSNQGWRGIYQIRADRNQGNISRSISK